MSAFHVIACVDVQKAGFAATVLKIPRRGMTPKVNPRAAGGRGWCFLPCMVPATHLVLDCGRTGAVTTAPAGPAAGSPRTVRPGCLIAVGGVHHGAQYARPVLQLSCGEAQAGSAPLTGMVLR